MAVFLLLTRGDDGYRVRMLFQNASQLVKGNLVQVSGEPIGTVEDITLTENGQAQITAKIQEPYAPLRQGTKAVVRQTSLSGIANRYIDLQFPGQNAPRLPNNGVIPATDTVTAVDLDQLFNVFTPRTRRSLQGVIKGFGQLYTGRQRQANQALAYLNPSISATRRLTQELAYDQPGLRGFINESANLVSDINERRDDLAALIVNLEQTTGAIARRDDELQSAIYQLPDFMRRANTTFVNLRATLDDIEPLVEESKPVARKLRPFLAELRPLARDARPTLRDLSALIFQPGPHNDLVDATESNLDVRDIAVRDVRRNGRNRRGAFPESAEALRQATPELEFSRPYIVDLQGWFDDFSHTGYYDALGSIGRVPLHVNAFALVNGLPLPDNLLLPFEQNLKEQIFLDRAQVGFNNRCPGSSERNHDGSNPFVPPPLDPDKPGGCDPDQMPPPR